MVATLFKTILYLVGGLLITPGALLAYYFWTVTGAARQKGLWELLLYLFNRFIQTIQWSMWLVLPGLLLWLAFAFWPKCRPIGSLAVSILAVASMVEFFIVLGPPKTFGDLFFPVISLAGIGLNLWLIWDDTAFLRTVG